MRPVDGRPEWVAGWAARALEGLRSDLTSGIMRPGVVGLIGAFLSFMDVQVGRADDLRTVEVPPFGERGIVDGGCRVLEGSGHAGRWHEMSFGVTRKAEWSLGTSSFNPGRIGEGQFVLSLDDKRQVERWCDAAWAFAVTDEAKHSWPKGVASPSSDRIWAVVMRRGEVIRTVHGKDHVPPSLRALVEFVIAKVGGRAMRAPLSELVLYFQSRYHQESSLFRDGWLVSEYRFTDRASEPAWRLSNTPDGSLFFVRPDGSSGRLRPDRDSLHRIERLMELAWPLAKRRPAGPDPEDPSLDVRSIRKSDRRVWLIAIRRREEVRTLEGIDSLPSRLEKEFAWVRDYTAKLQSVRQR